jgi:L-lactate dehydrogenase
MKVGIVGIGAVGTATAMALAMRASAHETILIDTNKERTAGVAADMLYGLPMVSATQVRSGDYGDLDGAQLVIIAAGINEKAGGATDRSDPLGRLRLLETNAGIIADIVPRIVAVVGDCPIMIASNPPEPLAEIARAVAGHPNVLSTSTALDTLRFRVQLARRFGVRAKDVSAYVVGEHGTNSVFLWSSAEIGGRLVHDMVRDRGLEFAEFRRGIEDDVRYANIEIIQGIGASQYGIGMVAARLAEIVLRDEHAIVAVGSHSAEHGTTLSFPSIIGHGGVVEVLRPAMADDERALLGACADRLKAVTRPHLDRLVPRAEERRPSLQPAS